MNKSSLFLNTFIPLVIFFTKPTPHHCPAFSRPWTASSALTPCKASCDICALSELSLIPLWCHCTPTLPHFFAATLHLLSLIIGTRPSLSDAHPGRSLWRMKVQEGLNFLSGTVSRDSWENHVAVCHRGEARSRSTLSYLRLHFYYFDLGSLWEIVIYTSITSYESSDGIVRWW